MWYVGMVCQCLCVCVVVCWCTGVVEFVCWCCGVLVWWTWWDGGGSAEIILSELNTAVCEYNTLFVPPSSLAAFIFGCMLSLGALFLLPLPGQETSC